MLYTSPVPQFHSPPHSCEQDRTEVPLQQQGPCQCCIRNREQVLCTSKGHSDPHTVLTGHHPLRVGKDCRTSCPCKQGWVSLLPWGSGTRRHLTFFFTPPQRSSQAPAHHQQVMLAPWDDVSGGSPLDLPYTSMAACWSSTFLTLPAHGEPKCSETAQQIHLAHCLQLPRESHHR